MIPDYLYNVTFDFQNNTDILEPYVPHTAAPDEDQETERVCLSTSVENCLTAMGTRTELTEGAHIRVRRVSTADLDPALIVTPEELFQTGRVPDAIENEEYWYLGMAEAESLEYEIESYWYERELAFTCIKADDIWDYVKKHFPDLGIKRCKDSRDMFGSVTTHLYDNGMYDECDEFEDAVADMPWAQVLRIKDVKLLMA